MGNTSEQNISNDGHTEKSKTTKSKNPAENGDHGVRFDSERAFGVKNKNPQNNHSVEGERRASLGKGGKKGDEVQEKKTTGDRRTGLKKMHKRTLDRASTNKDRRSRRQTPDAY